MERKKKGEDAKESDKRGGRRRGMMRKREKRLKRIREVFSVMMLM